MCLVYSSRLSRRQAALTILPIFFFSRFGKPFTSSDSVVPQVQNLKAYFLSIVNNPSPIEVEHSPPRYYHILPLDG